MRLRDCSFSIGRGVMAITQGAASSAELQARGRAKGLHWRLLPLALMVGVLGAVCDSRDPVRHSWWVNVHPWFVLLLLGLALAGFYLRVTSAPMVRRSDSAEFVRHASRSIYLLLYVVIFARELLNLVGVAWHNGSFDLPFLHSYLRLPIDVAVAGVGSDLRGYLACGILALMLIRALAAFHSRSVRVTVPRPMVYGQR